MVYITQVPSPNIMPQYPRISQVTHLIVDVSGLTSKVKYVCNTVKVVVLLDDIINIVRTPRKWTRPMDGAPASVRYKTRTASPMGFVVLETIGPWLSSSGMHAYFAKVPCTFFWRKYVEGDSETRGRHLVQNTSLTVQNITLNHDSSISTFVGRIK